MADLRKLGKGVTGALAQAKQLAAAEREANLQRMLEPSKVKQRLYHGTTATEGGKGKEAIRRLKPSKEGALGSGVYMTPNTAHASGYTGIPNDEAIESMLVNPTYQSTGIKALNQRNSGDLLPEQEGGNMLPVYAQLKNPLIIEGTHADPMIEALIKLGMDEASASKMVERAYEQKGYIGKQVETRARAAGYDGLMQYRDGDLSEVVSYNPNAIKSATGNQGTYDISNPDLSKRRGGVIHMADAGRVSKGVTGALTKAKEMAKTKKAGESKIAEMLAAQQAPMTTPSGTGLPLMPRDQGMYTPREQKDLPRMVKVDAARAAGKQPKYNERMQDLLDSPKARKKVDNLINKGKDLNIQEWYGTEPLRQVAMDAGRTPEQFESLMAQLASASQRNPVDKQNQMGSYLHHLSQTGQMPDNSLLLTNKLREELKVNPSLAEGRTLIELPEGYGSLAQGDIFNRALMIHQGKTGEALPPNKKLGTFYENLLGNLKPVTVDVNALRGPIIEQGDPRWLTSKLVEKDDKGKIINSYKPREMFDTGEMTMREAQQRPGFWEAAPSGSEYAGFEELWQRGAKRHGVEPAEAQALGWYGSGVPKEGDNITALKTKPENYVDNLERLIKRTAEQTGKSPSEVMNDMVTGKGFLRKDGGAVDQKADKAMMLADLRLRAMVDERMGMAKGGSVSIFDAPAKRMAKGGSSDEPTAREVAEQLGKLAVDQGKEEYQSYKKPRAATDIGNRGILAPALGLPVDMVNMGLMGIDTVSEAIGKPTRLSSEKPFAGSEHIKDLMNKYGVTSGEDRPMTETMLSLFSPTGMIKGAQGATKGAVKAAGAMRKPMSGLGAMREKAN
jgi:hypothetical protein